RAPVHVRTGLEHDHLEARLGEDRRRDRAAGARADDRHVALLAPLGWAKVPELRRAPVAGRWATVDLAAHLVADRVSNPRIVSVAHRGDHLQEQQQVGREWESRAIEPDEEPLPPLEARVAEATRKGPELERPEREPKLPPAAR